MSISEVELEMLSMVREDPCFYEEFPGLFETIREKTLEDSDRWALSYSQVFRYLKNGGLYRVFWSVGATEEQYEEYDPVVHAVEEREVKQVVYENVRSLR